MSRTTRLNRFCDGVTRRGMIQAGLGGLAGFSLPELLRLRAHADSSGINSAKSDTAVIYLELAGGPSQHETYDPKPKAPQEFRGIYSAIETAVPGVQFCELMSEQARIADKLTVIRSVHHRSGSHGPSSHLVQTGYYGQTAKQERKNDMPAVGSITAKARGAVRPGLPAYVAIPRITRYGGAGWLGESYNPFETVKDTNAKDFAVPNLTLINGLTADRVSDRRKLLTGFDTARHIAESNGIAEAYDDFTHQAFDLVTGKAAQEAFDLSREPDAVRDRYGRHSTGQNMLLARRLVEAGVTYVTIRVTGWDYHWDLKKRMESIAPPFDRGVAALVEDLHERGLDKKVLVIAIGEFGRTPKMNDGQKRGAPGRDHWGALMSVMLAGGGLRGGEVIGTSDSNGAKPIAAPYRPENVLSTVYRHLGIDPGMTFDDLTGRPRHILEKREPIAELV